MVTPRTQIALKLPGSATNPRNSEGSFVTLADGRIMFAYSRYQGDSWQDHAEATICARFSEDDGRSWSSRDTVIVKKEGRQNVMSVSLLRLHDNRVGLWYARKNSLNDCHPYMRSSSDEGKSWSRAKCCIPAPGYFVVNNDRVIQLSRGRLIIPAAYHRPKLAATHKSQEYYSGFESRGIAIFFLSDDAGKTWRESQDWWALPVRSVSGLQEPGVVELADGRLYAYCRTDLGCQYEMVSDDQGDTWSPPAPSKFQSPCSPLSIKRIRATGDLLAIWNDHSKRFDARTKATPSSWGRTPLVAAVSRNEGRTWRRHQLLETDPRRGFCYTAIHNTDDAVLLAYCCGGRNKRVVLQDLCIRRVPLDRLYS